jgi:hypothetical protein
MPKPVEVLGHQDAGSSGVQHSELTEVARLREVLADKLVLLDLKASVLWIEPASQSVLLILPVSGQRPMHIDRDSALSLKVRVVHRPRLVAADCERGRHARSHSPGAALPSRHEQSRNRKSSHYDGSQRCGL